MKKSNLIPFAVVTAVMLTACAGQPTPVELDKLAAQVAQASFRDQGVARVDRLVQDDANRECSAADVSGKPIDDSIGKVIEAANLKSVPLPTGGVYLGDWRSGERIAQNGRGLTWSDAAASPNGGNCYNCHQISKQEVSFGTIGPSLYNYGKLRGVKDPNSEAAKPIVVYTWGKLWNARSYSACSSMPRFGHSGILNEEQIRDVMALLLDPKSPVNE